MNTLSFTYENQESTIKAKLIALSRLMESRYTFFTTDEGLNGVTFNDLSDDGVEFVNKQDYLTPYYGKPINEAFKKLSFNENLIINRYMSDFKKTK